MFKRFKKNEKESTALTVSKKRKRGRFLAFALALCCMPIPAYNVSAAEGGIDSIVTNAATTTTSVITTLWGAITGNEYLSFCVGISCVLMVVLVLKRLVGAAKR